MQTKQQPERCIFCADRELVTGKEMDVKRQRILVVMLVMCSFCGCESARAPDVNLPEAIEIEPNVIPDGPQEVQRDLRAESPKRQRKGVGYSDQDERKEIFRRRAKHDNENV